MKYQYDNLNLKWNERGMTHIYPANAPQKESRKGLLPAVSTVEDGPMAGMEGCMSLSFNEDSPIEDFAATECGFSFSHKAGEIKVHTQATWEDGLFLCRVSAKNEGNAPKTLRHLSSSLLAGLDRGGNGFWFTPGKMRVHFCRYGWAREGQWCSVDLSDLGLAPGSDQNQGFQASYRFSSVGSWSTGTFYPLILLEDTEAHITYFTELLGATNWTVELGLRGDSKEGAFYMEANDADQTSGNWEVSLAPGECIAATPALMGCVQGDFDDAVHLLTRYKRRHTLSSWAGGVPKLCFNTYMNSLHGSLSAEALLPLIDQTAALGAEVFVIDAGWCAKPTDAEWTDRLGSWTPCESRFAPYTLQGIADYIKEKGMIPGIWMEVEALTPGSPLHQAGCYLKNPDGSPLCQGARHFTDMTRPEAREFLKNAIRNLYEMGFRYLKNDYNASTLRGPSLAGSSMGEGNRIYAAAVRDFFKEIRATFPDLILENCGSGAMRCDQGMLSVFTLQSITDEEGRLYMPSILAGSAAVMPPEKEGVWTYAYPDPQAPALPVPFGSEDYVRLMADGEETVFGMVTGMLGAMTWGGRLDRMDQKNAALTKEAAATYKQYRSYVSEGLPVYPMGFIRKGDGKNTAYGLWKKEEGRMLLSVFRFSEQEERLCVDLSRYGTIKSAAIVYPADFPNAAVTTDETALTVTLKKPYSARLLEICFE